jgi:hypothetical protein
MRRALDFARRCGVGLIVRASPIRCSAAAGRCAHPRRATNGLAKIDALKDAARSKIAPVTLTDEAERRGMVSVDQAAEVKIISSDTFKRNDPHLIVSERRRGLRLDDVLDDQKSPDR